MAKRAAFSAMKWALQWLVSGDMSKAKSCFLFLDIAEFAHRGFVFGIVCSLSISVFPRVASMWLITKLLTEHCLVMCEGLNANVHVSQTGLFSTPLALLYIYTWVYLFIELPTSHFSECVMCKNILEHSAVCAQLVVPFTIYIFLFSSPLPLCLAVILPLDFHPVESRVVFMAVCLQTVADTLVSHWGII